MRRIFCIAALLLAGCVFADAPDKGSQTGVRQLTINLRSIASASGKVTVNGTDCRFGSSLSVGDGASMTLASADATFQSFAIDCPGAGCKRTSSNPLSLQMTSDHVVEVTFRPAVNYMFVSSVGIGAGMGGLAAADAHCKARATSAGLGGTNWLAWLTTRGLPASARLESSRGWMRTDGLPFAGSVAAIERNETFYPPRVNEFGEDIARSWGHGFIPVWSGTYAPDPTYSGRTCNDWTSSDSSIGAYVGNAASGAGWNFSNAAYACGGWQLGIYCFETDYANPVTVPPPPPGSRIAFLAGNFTLTPGGSIADADARCMADATAAGLPGAFKALMADVGKPAMDPARFDVKAGPWYRRDGVAVVKLAADYLASGGPVLLAPIDLAADGRTRGVPLSEAFVGFNAATDDYTIPGTAETTCDGWSSNSSSRVAVASVIDFTLLSFEKRPNWPLPSCNQAASLYCLQQ